MSEQKSLAYGEARRAAHEALQRGEPTKVFNVGNTRVTLSTVRKVETELSLPEPFPKIAMKPGEDFDSWMK